MVHVSVLFRLCYNWHVSDDTASTDIHKHTRSFVVGNAAVCLNVDIRIISASLYDRSAYITGVARLSWTICLSPHVSSRVIPQCIGTPFGLVSEFRLGSGVPDFGGDRRRGWGSLGVNKMQKSLKMALFSNEFEDLFLHVYVSV